MSDQWIDVVVQAIRQEAEEIVGLDLAPVSGGASRTLPGFTAGAHIDIELAPDLVRQYSLCGDPCDTKQYSLAVLKEPESRGGSRMIHEKLQVGGRLRISAPKNHFPLEEDGAHAILLAGGIGITPILAMAEELHRAGRSFAMHYSCRTPARAAFVDRIRNSGWADQAQFHFDDGPPDQRLDLAALLGDPAAGTHFYVCGPQGLIDAALATANDAGWADANLHREYFGLAPDTVDLTGDCFRVRVASTGQVFDIGDHDTIADVLNRNGVKVEMSCEQGVCGTCLTRVISGTPDHRDMFLSPAEQAANNVMMVCCSRAKSAELELDL